MQKSSRLESAYIDIRLNSNAMILQSFDLVNSAKVLVMLFAFTLAGVHLSIQTRISRSLRHSMVIVSKLTGIYLAASFVLCQFLGLDIVWFNVIVLVIVALSTVASFERAGYGEMSPLEKVALAIDPTGGAIIFGVILPVYILKQFVLGFPEHDLFVVPPRRDSVSNRNLLTKENVCCSKENATVVSTLSPVGRIVWNGEQFDAMSSDGIVIDVGRPVEICAYHNNMFVVQPAQR